jgi:hypothetical protein
MVYEGKGVVLDRLGGYLADVRYTLRDTQNREPIQTDQGSVPRPNRPLFTGTVQVTHGDIQSASDLTLQLETGEKIELVAGATLDGQNFMVQITGPWPRSS